MKHVVLLLPVFLCIGMYFLLYQRGMEVKAQEQKQVLLQTKKVQQRKSLQACIAKEDASVKQSIQMDCTSRGVSNTHCRVTKVLYHEILARVDENKEICRLKYTD